MLYVEDKKLGQVIYSNMVGLLQSFFFPIFLNGH